MNASKHRILSFLLCLNLLVSATGCGSTAIAPADNSSNVTQEKQSAESVKESESAPAESPAPELKDVKLKFYFMGDKRAATDEVWTTIAEKYRDKLHADFEVNFIPFGDYKDKMMMMSASGDDWDLNFDGYWLSYPAMVLGGAYLDLNGLLSKYAPNLNATYEKQGVLSAATVDGKILSLPWTMKMNCRNYLLWRSDPGKKVGFEQPKDSLKTVEEVDAFLHAMQKALPGEKLLMNALDPMFLEKYELVPLSVGSDLYVDINDPTCKVIALEQHPAYRELATYAAKWYNDGILAKDALINKEDLATLWNNGRFLVNMTWHEWVFANDEGTDPTRTIENSLLYPDKKFPNQTPLANVVCLNKNAANPERTLMFLDMLETDRDLYDTVQYGIEGKTYVLKNGAAEYPAGIDAASSNYMDWGGQWAFWKPQFMRPNATYSEGFWEREAEFASLPNNVNFSLDGLFVNSDPIKNELVRRSQLIEEFGKPIRFGVTKDAGAAVDEYLNKQKEAGLDTIVAEVQKQVDAYLASIGK